MEVLMSCVDDGTCNCDCHKPEIRAICLISCCERCPDCRKRIRNGAMLFHKTICTSRRIVDESPHYERIVDEGEHYPEITIDELEELKKTP